MKRSFYPHSLTAMGLAAALLLAVVTLRPATAEEGWITLFDGKTLEGWVDGKGKPSANWTVKDGSIYRAGKGDHLYTTQQFKDFELEFEWKIGSGVNSGLKYRFSDGVGCEYQVLDDLNGGHEDKPVGQTAALYAVKPATGKTLRPVGEFNTSRVVAKGNHLEHWLNGVKVMEIEIGSPEWKELKAASKFKDRETFAMNAGPIQLQDHGGEAWFRNLRIRPL